nr:unnamed protein product [Haemonchus contortus]
MNASCPQSNMYVDDMVHSLEEILFVPAPCFLGFGVCLGGSFHHAEVNLLTCRAEGDLEEAEGPEAEAGVVEEGAGPDQRLQRDAADEVLAEEEGARGELRVIERDRDDRLEADAQGARLERDDDAAVGVVQGADQAETLIHHLISISEDPCKHSRGTIHSSNPLSSQIKEYIKGVERVGLVDLLTCRATGDLVEAEGLEVEAVAAEEEASLDQCPQHDAADEVLVEEEGAREELRVIARDRDDRSEADAQGAHLQRDDVAVVGVVVQGAEQAKAPKRGEAAAEEKSEVKLILTV